MDRHKNGRIGSGEIPEIGSFGRVKIWYVNAADVNLTKKDRISAAFAKLCIPNRVRLYAI